VCECVRERERGIEGDLGRQNHHSGGASLGPPHIFRPHIENAFHYEYQSYRSRPAVVRGDIRGGEEGEGGGRRTER